MNYYRFECVGNRIVNNSDPSWMDMILN